MLCSPNALLPNDYLSIAWVFLVVSSVCVSLHPKVFLPISSMGGHKFLHLCLL